MKIADTISVNPRNTTLGQSEKADNMFRVSIINKEASKNSLFSLAIPSEATGIAEIRKYALPLRTLFASILIVTGISIIQTASLPINTSIAIVEIIGGIFLAFGFLTRPIMLISAIFFGITTALSIRTGNTDFSILSLMFGCLIFSALGSGKYSIDFLNRRAMLRSKRKSKIIKSSRALGYKAFHYAEI